jgi:hypothetical protein
MSGKSNQEKAAEKQLQNLGSMQRDITGGKFNASNPFAGFQPQFNFSDISKQLNEIFGGAEDIINRDSYNAIAEGQRDATSALASRGITGGSIVDTTRSGVASDIGRQKANALTTLGTNKAQATADLMKYLNQLDVGVKGSQANVDLANQGNILSGLGNNQRLQAGLLGNLDNTTVWDDILSGIKVGADVGSAIAGIPGI